MNKPGMIIGYRKNGCPIRLIAGGSGEGDQGDAQGDADGSESEPGTEPTGEPEGDPDALGDAGKKALDAMKAKWRTERDERKRVQAELDALRNPPKQDDKPDADAIRREAETKAVQKANARILKAEVKAAAAGKLADPADALRLLDLSDFEVDSEGNVDADEIAEAIDQLVSKKPYLSAQGTRRFQGTGDGGAKKGGTEPKQWTREDLKGKSPEAIEKARTSGLLDELLGMKK